MNLESFNGWKRIVGTLLIAAASTGQVVYPDGSVIWIGLGAFGTSLLGAGFVHAAMKADPGIPTGKGTNNQPTVSEPQPYPKKEG